MMKGTSINCATGATSAFEHYLFYCPEHEIRTIVKVISVESYETPDNCAMRPDGTTEPFAQFQISVSCQGIDCLGSVFDLELDFGPDTIAERNKILEDVVADRIFMIRGRYSIISEIPCLIIHDPGYSHLCPDYSEEEVRECFRINSMEQSSQSES